MVEKEIDDLEEAVDMIEQFEKESEKKKPSVDTDSLMAQIGDMFDDITGNTGSSEDAESSLPEKQITAVKEEETKAEETAAEIEEPAVKKKKKKLKERRSKKKNRKEKFAHIAQESARATEEILAAKARAAEEESRIKTAPILIAEEQPSEEIIIEETASGTTEPAADDIPEKVNLKSKVSEMVEMIGGAIEEISQIKTEKKEEEQNVCNTADMSAQNLSAEETESSDTETHPEEKDAEKALNEPEEASEKTCNNEESIEEATEETDEETANVEPLTAEEELEENEEPALEEFEETKEETVEQEPEFEFLNNDDGPEMPDIDLSRTTHESDQRWQIFYMLGALLLIVSVYFGISFFNRSDVDNSNVISGEPVIEIKENEPNKPHMDPKLKDMWLANKAINSDYVGNIIFDSGLVDLPVVQAKNVYNSNGDLYTFYTESGDLVTYPEDYTGNDVYIWTNWKTGKYDPHGEGGSVFMDFTNSLDDQNLIIYGHHFARDYDPTGNKLFTPLDLFLEEENYEANKNLKLILNNEIREYVVTNVFIIDIDNDYELNFMRRNMNEDVSGNPDSGFFAGYIEYINRESRYEVSEKLNEEDRILTLVTCMQHQPQYRQIIICKETGREIYD